MQVCLGGGGWGDGLAFMSWHILVKNHFDHMLDSFLGFLFYFSLYACLCASITLS